MTRDQFRDKVIAAIKAKGPHAKPSTIADAVIPLCMEEAKRVAWLSFCAPYADGPHALLSADDGKMIVVTVEAKP